MKEYIDKVAHFMEDFGQPVRYQPSVKLSPRERLLRVSLLLEEVRELAEHLGVTVNIHIEPRVNATELHSDLLLDHLTDIAYVLFGTVCSCGLQNYFTDAFDEVHRSNMSKRNPDGTVSKNENGKVVKGPNYTPANFKKVLSDVRVRLESGGAFS